MSNKTRALSRGAVIVLWAALLAGPICPEPVWAGESVNMKLVFTNPSDTSEQKDLIKYYLPPELKKADVIDTAGLKIDYDSNRGLLYVHKDQTLKPKESVQFKMIVRDVWQVTDDELMFLRSQAETHLKATEGKDDHKQAKFLYDKIAAELEAIKNAQLILTDDIANRMESYRVNKERLRIIRNNVILLKDFKQEAEAEADHMAHQKEINLVIKANNPLDTMERKEKIVKYLPEGLGPDVIMDTQGFSVHFDPEKKAYFLQQEVTLKPQETRQFTVKIFDRWNIPEPKLKGYEDKTAELTEYLEPTEYKEPALYLQKEINRYIAEIRDNQSFDIPVKDRISNYAENLKREQAIKLNLLELERMATLIKERQRQKTLEELLKKLAPDDAMTWRIIYGTIVFLAVISALTYMLWWGQSKGQISRKYEDLPPQGGR
ncbi:MAG: hypothetical protein MOGMAGMI_00399 [Candidatus Omnitrophica bacterium]|nr:hypothetical protein [Candidatus Omnitrophota bacterium]